MLRHIHETDAELLPTSPFDAPAPVVDHFNMSRHSPLTNSYMEQLMAYTM